MEIELEGFQLSQTLDAFSGMVRSISTLDNYLLVGSTDLTCGIYEFQEEGKQYKNICKVQHSKEYIYCTHIAKIKD